MTPIYILVDKVDEIWDPTLESKDLIVGLLRASKETIEQLEMVNVIVFLRSDIYESLQFHDADKFHSLEERIVWNKSDLKEMVIRRAKLSTDMKGKNYSQEQIWQTFFSTKIENEDTFDYLLRYTLMRPRDLIQLCNLCRDITNNNKHVKIEANDILEAIPLYSEWKLKDLRDEYQIQYPFLEKVFLAMFYNTKSRITRDEITHSFESVKENLIKEFGSYYFEPLDNLLQILYNIGFLGVINGNRILYSFLGDKIVIPYASQFEVHPVFRWALAINNDSDKKLNKSSIRDQIVISQSNTYGSFINIGGIVEEVPTKSSEFKLYEEDALTKLEQTLRKFNGQKIPGFVFNVEGEISLPKFEQIIKEYRLESKITRYIDFWAVVDKINSNEKHLPWMIEISTSRNPRNLNAQLTKLDYLRSEIEAVPWFISLTETPTNLKEKAKNLNVMLTSKSELDYLIFLISGNK